MSVEVYLECACGRHKIEPNAQNGIDFKIIHQEICGKCGYTKSIYIKRDISSENIQAFMMN